MIDENKLDIILNLCKELNARVSLSKITKALGIPNTRTNQIKIAQLLKNRGYIKKKRNGLNHWVVNKYLY